MNILAHVRSSRDFRNAAYRGRAIIQRFGFGPGPIIRALRTYTDLTERYQCRPTFPVTAVLVERHPRLFQELNDLGVELAIHGYVHTNYTLMSQQQQREHFLKAVETFQRYSVPFSGFRSPYLNWNDDQMQVVAELGFKYSSNRTLAWEIPNENGDTFNPRAIESYQRVLRFYSAGDVSDELSLPAMIQGVLDLPVAMPDDEALADRLAGGNGLGSLVWLQMLERNYHLGELLVLNLHPERALIFADVLEALLQQARQYSPPVWLATLDEIALWWNERERTTIGLRQLDDCRYQVHVEGDKRAALLVRNVECEAQSQPWCQGYRKVTGRGAIIESSHKPCIGVSPDCPAVVVTLLRQLGFLVEESAERERYRIYFDSQSSRGLSPRGLLAAIEVSNAPLARLALWPNGAACALAVTGDVDCVTLGDFFRRLWEV